MKKAGIVVDNYKLDKFVEELKKGGFTEMTIVPFLTDKAAHKATVIQVEYTEDRLKDLTRICKALEFQFKHKN